MSTLTNALKGTNLECPIRPFGGTDHFDISHNRIVFVSKDPDLNPALHTKSNVYIRHINSWDAEDNTPTLQRVIIPGFEGASTSPVISPDGSKAAFLSMKAAGYEADKNQIFVLPDLDTTELVPQRAFAESGNYEGTWDRSPSSICFAPDSRSLLVIAEDYGYSRVFILKADLTNESQPRRLTNWGYVGECKGLPDGRIFISGSTLVDNSFYGTIDPLLPPAKQNEPAALTWTSSNSGKGNKFGLSPDQVSSIWTPASNKKINKEVHSIVVKPSHFDSSKKYPVAYLIHGGPQGSWADNWSTRWNPAVFAEQGYIVIAPNPTGSTGYGQAFTDAIRENWGGDPYQDIVNCFEWVGKNMPEADNSRAVALGASYGGYMMNWYADHKSNGLWLRR
jgi:dipeptidyl aminopeptidase/acylaminoacyl peptidase